MGKPSRRRRAALEDERLRLQYPGLTKYQRNPHFRHNVKKDQQTQKLYSTTMRMIEQSSAEVENVDEQKEVFRELKELHKYLPSLPVEVGQTAARVSRWHQQSTMEPTVVCLDGGLRTAREAVKVWLRQPSTPERPSEPMISIREASPITCHNLEGLQNLCNSLETQRFLLKRQIEEDRLRRQGVY